MFTYHVRAIFAFVVMLIMFLLLLSHHLSGVAEAQVHFFVADNMLHTLLSLLMLSCFC